MVASSADEAVGNAKAQTSCEVGMCLKIVRTWLEIPSHYGSADDAWYGAKKKHSGDRNPPKGAPVFYLGGEHGHIALSLGTDDDIRSTDCSSSGKVASTYLDWPDDRWGHDYVGWAEDLNGVTIPWLSGGSSGGGGSPSGDWASGDVYLSKLHYGQEDSDSVRRLQHQLNGVSLDGGQELPITGNYLDETDQEVRLWQEQVCGDPPDAAGASFLGPQQAATLFPSPPYTLHDDT